MIIWYLLWNWYTNISIYIMGIVLLNSPKNTVHAISVLGIRSQYHNVFSTWTCQDGGGVKPCQDLVSWRVQVEKTLWNCGPIPYLNVNLTTYLLAQPNSAFKNKILTRSVLVQCYLDHLSLHISMHFQKYKQCRKCVTWMLVWPPIS